MERPATLLELARACTAPDHEVRLSPRHLGLLERRDGWQMRDWGMPWQLCYLIHSGTCSIRAQGRLYQAGPGEAICFRGDRQQHIAFSQILRFSEVRFRIHAGDCELVLAPAVQVVEGGHDGLTTLDQCAAEQTRAAEEPLGLVLRHRLGLLLAQLHQAQVNRQQHRGPRLSLTQRDRLQRWVTGHLAHDPTPADLARVLGYQSDYFSRLFCSTYGLSPRAWLVGERMRAACRLLREGDLAVGAVAEQLGYASTSHFCRQFRKLLGLTPQGYRRQERIPYGVLPR
jgi:AraC-like DNA-binding protein